MSGYEKSTEPLRVLDLFSGIGGFSLGLEAAGMVTRQFCEIDPYCQKVLNKHWPGVPVHDDIGTLDGRKFRGSIDLVCGGFPCQDLSSAGEGKGFDGDRSSLYREMLRVIGESGCGIAIFENVSNLLFGDGGRWFAKFLYDLAQVGFNAIWHCIPASAIGAHHHRDRVWIVAYADQAHIEGSRLSVRIRKELTNFNRRSVSRYAGKVLADTHSKRQQGEGKSIKPQCSEALEEKEAAKLINGGVKRAWPPEPSVGRVANGVPDGSHRLAALGNAVVPQIPEIIGRALIAELSAVRKPQE